jgi:hypothetical protein
MLLCDIRPSPEKTYDVYRCVKGIRVNTIFPELQTDALALKQAEVKNQGNSV